MNTSRLEQLRKLHAADPEDADISYMVAQELGTAKEFERAIEWYDKCIKADSGYCYAYFFKAIAQDSLGRQPDAIATLNTGLIHAHESRHPKTISELTALLEEFSA